jgi:hypothetical protein
VGQNDRVDETIQAEPIARAYVNPAGGLAHRHGAIVKDRHGWQMHEHAGGGVPHTHDPETGGQVLLAAGQAVA